MINLLHRFKSNIATKSQAHDNLEDMLIELRARGINFDIRLIQDDGKKYFIAKSVDYPRGSIITSGDTVEELEKNLKDAIFTAFEVPARFCHPALINIHGALFESKNTDPAKVNELVRVTT